MGYSGNKEVIFCLLPHPILMENQLASLDNSGQDQSSDHPGRVLGLGQIRKWS